MSTEYFERAVALACSTRSKLKASAVAFKSEPKQEPWGTFAIFTDPDGNQFVLGSK